MTGANVVVKNSNPIVGTATDADGGFSLKVPSGYNRLLVSCVGYQAKEVEVTDQETYEIKLEDGGISSMNAFFFQYSFQIK